MIFSIVILLLIGVIAYFHWVQGMFSGVISMVCAIVASLLAFSYHEQLAQSLFATKMTDQGHAISLVLLFAVSYLVLRVVFDNLVPGNVRLPATVDKVGGGITGFIAGIFAAGTLAIAVQSLPFGPDIGGYTRYATAAERDVKVPLSGRGQFTDTYVYDELKSDKFENGKPDPDEHSGMLLPADDIVVGMVRTLSDGGALAGARPLNAVHEDYVDELFYQRLGVQLGARKVMVNTEKTPHARAEKAYLIDKVDVVDGELGDIRNRKLPPALSSNATQALVAIRIRFTAAGSDNDKNIRLAPAAVRLFANGKNYLPLGTLEGEGMLVMNRPDDYLVFESDSAGDFVFQVPRAEVLESGGSAAPAGNRPAGGGAPAAAAADAPKPKFRAGVFVEVKRMARTELASVGFADSYSDAPGGPLRKTGLSFEVKEPAAAATPSAQAPAAAGGGKAVNPAASTGGPGGAGRAAGSGGGAAHAAAAGDKGPFAYGSVATSARLATPINVGAHDSPDQDVKFNSGTATLKGDKFAKLDVKPVDPISELSKGDKQVSEFFVPDGTALVQVTGKPASADAWKWVTNIGAIDLVDDGGVKYKPNGAWARVTKDGQERLFAYYDSDNPVTTLEKADGAPAGDVTVAFLLPKGTKLARIEFNGEKFADLTAAVE